MFNLFDIDPSKDTVKEAIEKISESGMGICALTTSDEQNNPTGMFLILTEAEAIPYVERALELYREEGPEPAIDGEDE